MNLDFLRFTVSNLFTPFAVSLDHDAEPSAARKRTYGRTPTMSRRETWAFHPSSIDHSFSRASSSLTDQRSSSFARRVNTPSSSLTSARFSAGTITRLLLFGGSLVPVPLPAAGRADASRQPAGVRFGDGMVYRATRRCSSCTMRVLARASLAARRPDCGRHAHLDRARAPLARGRAARALCRAAARRHRRGGARRARRQRAAALEHARHLREGLAPDFLGHQREGLITVELGWLPPERPSLQNYIALFSRRARRHF